MHLKALVDFMPCHDIPYLADQAMVYKRCFILCWFLTQLNNSSPISIPVCSKLKLYSLKMNMAMWCVSMTFCFSALQCKRFIGEIYTLAFIANINILNFTPVCSMTRHIKHVRYIWCTGGQYHYSIHNYCCWPNILFS